MVSWQTHSPATKILIQLALRGGRRGVGGGSSLARKRSLFWWRWRTPFGRGRQTELWSCLWITSMAAPFNCQRIWHQHIWGSANGDVSVSLVSGFYQCFIKTVPLVDRLCSFSRADALYVRKEAVSRRSGFLKNQKHIHTTIREHGPRRKKMMSWPDVSSQDALLPVQR